MNLHDILTQIEDVLKDEIPFETITIKKSSEGKIKRVTIHREHDIFLTFKAESAKIEKIKY